MLPTRDPTRYAPLQWGCRSPNSRSRFSPHPLPHKASLGVLGYGGEQEFGKPVSIHSSRAESRSLCSAHVLGIEV